MSSGRGHDPRATFVVLPSTTVAVGQLVTLDASATTAWRQGSWSAANVASYQWDDDVDNLDPLDNPYYLGSGKVCTYTWTTVGTKYVWLTVRDLSGRVAQTRTPVIVTASAPVPPPPTTTVPGAPSIQSVVAGNAKATVNFSAPASNGGSPIIDYEVTIP